MGLHSRTLIPVTKGRQDWDDFVTQLDDLTWSCWFFFPKHAKFSEKRAWSVPTIIYQVVASNIFLPLLFQKWSNLTHIFQMGWNHQLGIQHGKQTCINSKGFEVGILPNMYAPLGFCGGFFLSHYTLPRYCSKLNHNSHQTRFFLHTFPNPPKKR